MCSHYYWFDVGGNVDVEGNKVSGDLSVFDGILLRDAIALTVTS